MKKTGYITAAFIAATAMLWLTPPAGAVSTYSYIDLGELGAYGELAGVNNNGYVAGYSKTASTGPSNAWVWSSGNGFTPLGNLGGSTEIYSGNNLNQGVGGAADSAAGWNWRAVLFSGGTATSLGTLGGNESEASGINNSGQVVGWADTATSYQRRAFVWDGTNGMREVPTGTTRNSEANAINDHGHVVGAYDVNGTSEHPFIYDLTNNTMSDLGPLAGMDSGVAQSINNSGQVVGMTYDSTSDSVFRAFMWDSANGMKDIGTLGGLYSRAFSINEHGQIGGVAENAAGQARAFLYEDGAMYDLNNLVTGAPGLGLTISNVNDNGQITAVRWNPGVSTHAYLLTPTGITYGSVPTAPMMPDSAPGGYGGDGGTGGGTFGFTIPSPAPGKFFFLDPLVAVGYDYLVNSGPLFQSVLLPNIGDGLFDLWLWDGTNWVFSTQLTQGVSHDFGAGGIDRFRILGIEGYLGLDPNDPNAFVTGLTFNGTDTVNMSMHALTEEVNASTVPEPSTWLLMGAGLVGLVGIRTRRMAR